MVPRVVGSSPICHPSFNAARNGFLTVPRFLFLEIFGCNVCLFCVS